MSDTIELNDKLVSELREIAKSLGIAEADELRKPQLITSIVEQQQLIEAARAQQNAVESNYTPINVAAAEPVADKARKRTRTLKVPSNKPRVDVPLDDTNQFDMQDYEPQAGEPELERQQTGPANEQEGETEAKAEDNGMEVKPQKFERRVNNNQNGNAPQKKPGAAPKPGF